MNNIFKLGIYRHTPRHWLRNIVQFFRNIKYAFQRAARGFADPDWWDLDTFVATILRDGCREMAKHHHGYPANICDGDKEESCKKWEETLKEIASHFGAYIEKDLLEVPDDAEDAEDYLEVLKEAYRKGEEEYLAGLHMLKEWHGHLWD